MTENVCGQQSLKYLPPGLSKKNNLLTPDLDYTFQETELDLFLLFIFQELLTRNSRHCLPQFLSLDPTIFHPNTCSKMQGLCFIDYCPFILTYL